MSNAPAKPRRPQEPGAGFSCLDDLSPNDLVEASRHELQQVDEPVLRSYFIDATVDLVLKEHRRAVQALSRRPEAEQRRAVELWGERHAWRHVASPCLARLIDIVAEFDRRESNAAIEAETLAALKEIGVAPFEADALPKASKHITGHNGDAGS